MGLCQNAQLHCFSKKVNLMAATQNGFLSVIRLIPATVWALGLMTLLLSTSTTMVFALTPLYLTSVMGLSFATLGRYEGMIEGTSWAVRIFSGPLSDMLSKRKPLLVAAWSCVTLSRVLLPYASTIGGVVFARVIDRIGNGLQASPREALIGDVAPPQIKSSCYGLRQTLGLLGSFLGALLAIYIMRLTKNDYILSFWVALIPALLAGALVIFFVKDAVITAPRKTFQSVVQIFAWNQIKQLNANYRRVVVFAGLFMLSYYSGAFPILQAKSAGLPDDQSALVMVIQNFAGFMMAFPAGWLADRFGYKKFLISGCILSIIGDLLIAQTTSLPLVLLGIGVWGSQLGMMSGIISSKVSEYAPPGLRATAFALYFGVNGVMVALSNGLAGHIAHTWGLKYVFYTSSTLALIAMCSVCLLPKDHSLREKTI